MTVFPTFLITNFAPDGWWWGQPMYTRSIQYNGAV